MGAPYGQHFLRNRGAIDAILRAFEPRPGDHVVEIGPGRGALTYPLVSRVASLAAVEVDPVLARSLAEALLAPLMHCGKAGLRSGADPGALDASAGEAPPGTPALLVRGARGGGPSSSETTAPRGRPAELDPESRGAPAGAAALVLHADALEVRYAEIAALLGCSAGPLRVIGNLPYAIATALLRRMLAERDLVRDALFMVQKEVADRILAGPGQRAYGFLAVLVALSARRGRVLTLEPGSFSPPPRVRSTVVALRFHPPEPGFPARDERLVAVLRASFAERRKKLAANLVKHYRIDRAAAEKHLVACGADPGARAEALPPEAFRQLADELPDAPSWLEREIGRAREPRT